MKILTAILFASSVLVTAGSTEKSFDRYRTIIDRKPFGPEPVNFDPEAAPSSVSSALSQNGVMTEEQRTEEELKLASNVRVSMINVTPSGVVKVGFTDSGINPPENYYLAVGGMQNGWMVKSANPSEESVTLKKNDIEVTVKLGESTGGKGAGSVRRSEDSGRAVKANLPAPAAAGGNSMAVGGLARLRRKHLREAALKRENAEKAAAAEAKRRMEQEEREAKEAAEKEAEAEARAQQLEELRQIKEQLRKQREEKEAAQQQNQEAQNEADNAQ